MNAHDEIAGKIRKAIGHTHALEDAQRAWQQLPRLYNSVARRERESDILLLEDRLRDYDAKVVRCATNETAGAIERMLTERGKRQMLVPEGLPAAWLPSNFDFVIDNAFTAMELDQFEGVLTCASLAIAETGTVVLQNIPGQGRRALSLVPDYHLCLVKVEDVVATVPEAMARLQATAHLATTFISGPSATADIEMTRIKGVHGPRILDVLLLG